MGGLGLTGPGAFAAARAILATPLSDARSSPEDPAVSVIVPADAAGLLLASTSEADGDPGIIPGLSQPVSLTAALDEIEALILRRARLAPSSDDHWPPRAATAAGPKVALFAIPTLSDTRRLHSIIASGQDFGVMVIVLGEWPYGVTCDVAADGTITAVSLPDSGLAGVRLYCLSLGDFSAATGLNDALPSTPLAESPAVPASRSLDRELSRSVPPAVSSPDPHHAPAMTELAHEGSRPVRISVLGPLQITAGGREIGTGPRKARELLAFLAVHGADGATGDAISEALWPGAPPGYGARQRNVALRKARDLLRSSTGRSTPMWITLTVDRYRLDPALIESDLWHFQAALETARAAGTDQDRLVAYRQAASRYRGPLCDSAGYDWAESHAETARHHALDAWTRIAGILQDTDPEQALAALETALTHDPYNEYIYQQIMRLHAAEGRTDAVRRTFELLQARLIELGITTLRTSTRQVVAALLGDSGPNPRPAGPSSTGAASAGPAVSVGLRDPARGKHGESRAPRSGPRR